MKSLLAMSLLLLFAGWTVAADELPMDPEELLDVQEHTLANGLRLLMVEDHSAPLVHYTVYYRVGSRHERPGITGMAHFFEHMMFRGSKKYAPEEHAHIVQAHGGTLNASTWYDRTAYYENISSEYLELVIHLEAERQANLQIKPEIFEPERNVIIEERKTRVDNSLYGAAMELLITNVYRAHPYNWPVIGWMSDIKNYRQEDMEQFYKTYYAPNNATVIIAGDFESEEAIELVEKYYGGMEAQPIPWEPQTVEPPQQGERRITFQRPAQLPFLFAAYRTPAAVHEDMPALLVAQKILSDGESSRIYKQCVYDTQVARFAGGSLYELHDPGVFMAYIGVNAGRELAEAEQELFGVIEGMAESPPSEEELQKAINQIEADFFFSLQTVRGKASMLGESLMTYDDPLYSLKQIEMVKQVSAEDVQRAVATYFRPINRTVLILEPDMDAQPVNTAMGGEDQ